jgi:hypothetical protein
VKNDSPETAEETPTQRKQGPDPTKETAFVTTTVVTRAPIGLLDSADELAKLEAAIESELKVEATVNVDRVQEDASRARSIGRALAQIKAGELYQSGSDKKRGFGSYASARFGFTRSNADYYIAHSKVCDTLPADVKLPSVRQSRMIAPLLKIVDTETVARLTQKVVARNVTGSSLKAMVRIILDSAHDRSPVPYATVKAKQSRNPFLSLLAKSPESLAEATDLAAVNAAREHLNKVAQLLAPLKAVS